MPVLLFVIRFGLSRTLVSRVSLSSFNRLRASLAVHLSCPYPINVRERGLGKVPDDSFRFVIILWERLFYFHSVFYFRFAFRFARWTLCTLLGDFLRLSDQCCSPRIDGFNIDQWQDASDTCRKLPKLGARQTGASQIEANKVIVLYFWHSFQNTSDANLVARKTWRLNCT